MLILIESEIHVNNFKHNNVLYSMNWIFFTNKLTFTLNTKIIAGAANLDISKNGNVAVRTIVYFVLTSVFNVCLGLTLGLIVHPGSPDLRPKNMTSFSGPKKMNAIDGFLDMGKWVN